jgi:hypothetical protein
VNSLSAAGDHEVLVLARGQDSKQLVWSLEDIRNGGWRGQRILFDNGETQDASPGMLGMLGKLSMLGNQAEKYLAASQESL